MEETYRTKSALGTAREYAVHTHGVPLSEAACAAARHLGFAEVEPQCWPGVSVAGLGGTHPSNRGIAVVEALESRFGSLAVGSEWNDRTGDNLVFRLPSEMD